MGGALFRCEMCDHRMSADDIVRATLPHPKSPYQSVVVMQCPECGECERFTNVCDEPGCAKDAGCGWSSAAGYRRTCVEHWQRER